MGADQCCYGDTAFRRIGFTERPFDKLVQVTVHLDAEGRLSEQGDRDLG